MNVNSTALSLAARTQKVPASPIRKLIPLADVAKKKGVHVYHLNIGQPDLPSPEAFLKALGEYPSKVIAYGRSEGELNLREAYQAYFRRFGIDLEIPNIMVATGGSEALLFTFFIVANPGDEIVVFEPFYTNYNGFASIVDVKLVPVPTAAADGFHLPAKEAIEAVITPRTRAIAICSPNNPTGTVLSKEEMERVAEIALQHNLFIISDEVYREFAYDGERAISMLSFPEAARNVIVTDSISKRFCACGARVGCIVSRNEEFMKAALRMAQARLSPPVVECHAAVAALKLEPKDYVEPMIAQFSRRRDVIFELASQIPGIVCVQPKGAFYMMPAFPVDDAEKFVSWTLTEFDCDGKTVMLAPGAGFYATPGRGLNEARIAYVLNENDLAAAMKCLAAALQNYPGRTS